MQIHLKLVKNNIILPENCRLDKKKEKKAEHIYKSMHQMIVVLKTLFLFIYSVINYECK